MIGLVAQLLFGMRFLVQWRAAEKAGSSITPKLFWHLSLAGNILLLLHSLIHLHFAMSLAQSLNGILSWRNLNLHRGTVMHVILMLLFTAFSVMAYFAFHIPDAVLPTGIHLFGMIGIIAFGMRFWVQWWQTENNKSGQLTESFWWISLFGAISSGIYFFITEDWVNFIGPLFGLIPYSRNLLFLRRA